jgi:hypothetical protein
MPLSDLLRCEYCGKTGFSSLGFYNAHVRQTTTCRLKYKEDHPDEGEDQSQQSMHTEEGDNVSDLEGPYFAPDAPRRERVEFALNQNVMQHDMDALKVEMQCEFDAFEGGDDPMMEDDDETSEAGSYWRAFADKIGGEVYNSEEERDDSEENREEPIIPELVNDSTDGPNTRIRDQFQEYVAYMSKNSVDLTDDEKTAVKLLDILRRKKAPINAYDSLMTWHFRQRGWIRAHQSASASSHYISRKTILKTLTKRYNAENKFPYQRELILPASGTTVKVSLHNAGAVLQRLLTHPMIEEDDYIFFNDDPRAGPPADMVHIADLNTGQAYLDTHKELIGEDGEQLMGIPMYIDGAAVSQFHHMEIVAVKISLSIFSRDARMKEHLWATLGYVEKVHKHGGRGQKIREETNHMEYQDAQAQDLHGKDAEKVEGVGDMPLQDWHAMVKVILEGLVGIQETGLMWDLAYKGKVYKDLHYKTFIPFVKCDNKEADAMCGRFQDRTKCQQICRYCHILTAESDDHMHKIKYKTVREVQKLVERKNKKGLKEISQHYLTNAFHDLRFSVGNGRGIHGSCPSEMLHALLLGLFSYLREIFFTFLGPSSAAATEIDALSKLYCDLFQRQSDRTLPQTSFSKGLRTGHLMAKEFRGILLVMLTILRSTKGREVMGNKKYFEDTDTMDDWILLVEMFLQWEAYLNEKEMMKVHLHRLKRKNRYIMWLMRKIATRTKGMGLKLIKFHTVLHAVEDIIQFGIPTEFDTSANESHHKPSKQAAKLTQRAASTFNFQTATRLVEFHLLDLGMEEIDHDRKLWEYYQPFEESDDEDMDDMESSQDKPPETSTGETQIKVLRDKNDHVTFKMITRSKFRGKITWIQDVVNFLFDLQVLIAHHSPTYSLPIYTCHRRDKQIFRGHPNYRGKGHWRDWVWVDWGQEGHLPCQIWCFLVLKGLPQGRNTIDYGGCKLTDGTYAVVETGKLERNEDDTRSEILQAFVKEVGLDNDGRVTDRNFYLAETDAFVGPCAVIPDLGGPPNRYFVVEPRGKWVDMFVSWLKMPHNQDVMEPLDESSEEEEEESSISEEEDEMGIDQEEQTSDDGKSEDESSDGDSD